MHPDNKYLAQILKLILFLNIKILFIKIAYQFLKLCICIALFLLLKNFDPFYHRDHTLTNTASENTADIIPMPWLIVYMYLDTWESHELFQIKFA